jgi:uncharacterized protein CbrC (UPF0167 family)
MISRVNNYHKEIAMDLPIFKYFPDPVGLGSIVASENECVCCKKQRGYVYALNPYAPEDHCEEICPWCIADGTAAELIEGQFNDELGVGGHGAWEEVSPEIIDEVSKQTPGFAGIQDEQWFTHCADAAEFHGYVTKERLISMGPKVVEDFLESLGEETYSEFLEFGSELLETIREDGAGQGYIFRCRHCGCHGGYVDRT